MTQRDERYSKGQQAPIGIGFSRELKELLEKLAEQEHRSFSAQVKQLILEGLEARKANARK